MKVLHIIIGMNVGGAELMLKRLVESYKSSPDHNHTIISLTTIGELGCQLQSIGVDVQALGMRSPFHIPCVLWQLMRIIRESHPDIVQTWMYHSDLLGGLAARLAGNRNVIWGIRGSAIPQRGMSATQLVVSLCAWMSHFLPRVIVCCAESAKVAHVALGYDKSKMIVVPNGYDLSYLNTNPILRRQARAEFGFGEDDVVVGVVGRFDPLKDYKNFILAATILVPNAAHVKFLMIGRDVDPENIELKSWIDKSRFPYKFVLAGERRDIPYCLASMDVFCLSSCKEGFPNVVCEAMAMRIPCVVTDAGDAAEIVSDTGIIVAPCDPEALASALLEMINKSDSERTRLGGLARNRIEKKYSIEIASARFEEIYNQLTN